MIRLFALAALATIASLTVGCSPQRAMPMENCGKIDAIFEGAVAADDPGFAVAVGADGAVACTRNYGLADIAENAPITDETRFNIASVSKALTAWAAASLTEAKTIDLDAPLSETLPKAPVYARAVTLRQMLQHTSGVRDTGTMYIMSGRSASDPISNEDALALLDRQHALNFNPGERFLYSNGGYLLAALAMEAAAHKSFSILMQELVFAPTGMTKSEIMDAPGEPPEDSAKSYAAGDASGNWIETPHLAGTIGSTNVYASAGDLTKWGLHFLAAAKKGDTRATQMTAPARLNNGQSEPYGMGLELTQYRGQTVWMHGGSESGYRSTLIMLPAKGIVVSVLGNGSKRPQALAEMVLDALFGDAFEEPAPRRTPSQGEPLSAEEIGGMTGFYEFEAGRDAQIMENDGAIVIAVDPFGFLPMETISNTALLHAPSQVRVTFSNLGKNGFDSLTLSGVGPDAHAERVAAAPAPTGSIAAGRFYSPELGAEYLLSVDSGTLYVTAPGQTPVPLTLLENGRYVFAPFGLAIEIETPDRFILNTWRVKNILFERR